MVAITNIQKIFQVPSNFTRDMKVYAAQLIIKKIKDNTNKGISADGSKFPSYSKGYKDSLDFENAGKTNKVNLQLSGDMLASLEVVSIDAASVTIGYNSDSEYAGQVEGNQIGSYGSSFPNTKYARPFIGLPPEELKFIIDKVSSEMATSSSAYEVTQSLKKQDRIINSLLGRLLGG